MNISDIKVKVISGEVEITRHVWMRFQQRNISYSEVKTALINGEVIEDYPDDYPYPSCLVCGNTSEGRILHVVVGMGETRLWIITAYEPDAAKWNADFTVRR